MHAVARHAPATDPEEYYAALLAGQAYLHSLGVTGWQDAIVGDYAGMDDPGPVYLRAARSGDLTADVVGALWWDRDRGAEQVPDLVARRAAYSHGRFRATSVKIMQDGVAENGTAALTAPYLDRCGHATGNRGHSFVDADALRDHVAALAAAGFQVHVHAIGDRGVREALDAFDLDRLDQRGRPSAGTSRHHIAHLQLVHPDDVRRFADLGVTANAQALWACLDEQMTELTLPFLGPERARWQYPFGDLHRAGARLAMGSDWPVSTPDPLAAIHTAVNRTAYGEPGRAGTEPFLPEQAVALETAFAAYTSGSAWLNHRDDAGVLEPGSVADLVVLDRDPFAGPPERDRRGAGRLDLDRRNAGIRRLKRLPERNPSEKPANPYRFRCVLTRLSSSRIEPGRHRTWLGTRHSRTSSTASSSTRRRGRPTTSSTRPPARSTAAPRCPGRRTSTGRTPPPSRPSRSGATPPRPSASRRCSRSPTRWRSGPTSS